MATTKSKWRILSECVMPQFKTLKYMFSSHEFNVWYNSVLWLSPLQNFYCKCDACQTHWERKLAAYVTENWQGSLYITKGVLLATRKR